MATGHGIYPIKMYAGSVELEFEVSGDNEDGLDRVKPLGGWWAYEKAGAKTNKKGCIVNVIENSRSFLD